MNLVYLFIPYYKIQCLEFRKLGLVHWDDPEGWYGEGGGGFRMGNTCIPVADSF